MADQTFLVLSRTSETIGKLLFDAMNEPDYASYLASGAEISYDNPKAALLSTANYLSIWLYRIEENEFLKNQPAPRPRPGETPQIPPLCLDLSYLITPLNKNAITNQQVLGRVMQVLYDNSITPLHLDSLGIHEDLRITLGRMSLEEISRVWDSLNEPMRLSVCYRVTVNRISSGRVVQGRPVRSQRTNYQGSTDN